MRMYKFSCGCSFPIIRETPMRIEFKQDMEDISFNFNCQATWDLIGRGDTVGVFQIESQLGRKLAKDLKPENIEQLSALTAIMRPGSIEAVRDGKSVTQHYIDRKNKLEPVEYYHPSLKPILESTYGEMIYQEQAMKIAQDIAGFDLQQADNLRKAIGKKKPELMAKAKTQFIEGCKTKGIVTDEQAEEIFGWIEKSQRYSFNKSHSVSYGLIAYLTAYNKAHFIKSFYTSWLQWSQEKQDVDGQHYQLINDSKKKGILVNIPDIRLLNQHFSIVNNDIYVGITDIKGVGKAAFEKIKEKIGEAEKLLNKALSDMSWIEFLIYIASNVNSKAIEAIISSGALSYLGLSRNKMVYELNTYNELSASASKYIADNYHTKQYGDLFIALNDAVKNIKNSRTVAKTKDLLSSLSSPTHSLEDGIGWMAQTEKNLFGISITCNEVDAKDTSDANCTCKEYNDGVNRYVCIAVKVDEVREWETKGGKNPGTKMAFVKISDNTCGIEGVVFGDAYSLHKSLLYEGNTIIVGGQKGKSKDSGLVIDKVWQL